MSLDVFVDHLEAEDDLAALLRVHLYVEAGLSSLICGELTNPGAINITRMRFREKIDLAVALDAIREDDRPPLIKLNALRNKISHQLDYKISEKDVDEIYRSFDSTLAVLADGAAQGRGGMNLRTLLLTFVMAFHGPLSNELVAGWDEEA